MFQPDETLIVKAADGKYYERTGGCTLGCGKCCEAVIIPLDRRVRNHREFQDWCNWLALHKITVMIDDEKGYFDAHIPISCEALQPDKSCGLWKTPMRPQMCSTTPRVPGDLTTVEDVCTYTFKELS